MSGEKLFTEEFKLSTKPGTAKHICENRNNLEASTPARESHITASMASSILMWRVRSTLRSRLRDLLNSVILPALLITNIYEKIPRPIFDLLHGMFGDIRVRTYPVAYNHFSCRFTNQIFLSLIVTLILWAIPVSLVYIMLEMRSSQFRRRLCVLLTRNNAAHLRPS